ncbi:MAG: type II secretion system F family protein [Carbonactinosporaceae bacterium]
MSTAVLAIAAAAVAGWLLTRSRGSSRPLGRLRRPELHRRRTVTPPPLLLVAVAAAGGGSLALQWGSVVPAVAAPAAGVLLHHRRRVRDRDRAVASRRAAVLTFTTTLADELRAGRAPREALERSGGLEPALLAPVLSSARLGGDVPAALQAVAGQPGAEPLRRLAACWHVAEATGAGLARSAERLSSALRDEEHLRREVGAQLAGTRATAGLLALLPFFGLLLGSGVGAHPVQVLLHDPYGQACLVVGLTLDLVGVLWVDRIARAAERAA